MNAMFRGEGQKFFPHFFPSPIILIYVFFLLGGFFPAEARGQEKEKLSAFDRWAEEAALLNKRGKFEQVVALLEPHAQDPKNDSALFFNELGVAYRNQGKLAAAIQAYGFALARDPENPVITKNLGDAFFLNREYARAAEQYAKVVRANPRFQQAYSGLGMALYYLQKYPEALDNFDIVLKLNPGDEQAKKFKEAILKKLPASRKSK